MPEPLCLLGGWAAYLTVNGSYKRTHGRDYLGSKDIDVGFHIDENDASRGALQNSAFSRSIRILEDNGFYLIGSRLVQHYHRNTKQPLTEQESKRVPLYDMFDLYVDPIVDRVIPEISAVLGINPIDEPLLQHVFEHKRYRMIKAFGANLLLPDAEVLLATKINSVLKRQKDHKRTKDVADVYALIWYSGVKSTALRKKLSEILDVEVAAKVLSQLNDKDFGDAAAALGVTKDEISAVVKNFALMV